MRLFQKHFQARTCQLNDANFLKLLREPAEALDVIPVPLGFGKRLFRIPYVSIGIAVVCTLVYLLDPLYSGMSKYKQSYHSARYVSGLFEAAPKALLKSCELNYGNRMCPKASIFVATEREVFFNNENGNRDEQELRKMDFLRKYEIKSGEIRIFELLAAGLNGQYDKSLKSFAPKQWNEFLKIEAETQKAEQLFSPLNPNLYSLVLGGFRHWNIWHLLGNMTFLLIFGTLLEQRLSRVKVFLLFVLSNLSGLYVQNKFQNSDHMVLMGATGAVAGFLGATTSLFFHHRMGVALWMLKKRKVLFLQYGTIACLVYLGAQFAGVFETQGETLLFVHLMGALVGFVFGVEERLVRDLAYPLISPLEEEMMFEMSSSTNHTHRMKSAVYLLERNRENLNAKAVYIIEALRSRQPVMVERAKSYFQEYVSVVLREGKTTEFASFLDQLHFSLEWNHLISRFSYQTCQDFADTCLLIGDLGSYVKFLSAMEASGKHPRLLETYFSSALVKNVSYATTVKLHKLVEKSALAPRCQAFTRELLRKADLEQFVAAA